MKPMELSPATAKANDGRVDRRPARRETETAKRSYEPPKILPLGSIEVVQYGNGNNIDSANGWYFPD